MPNTPAPPKPPAPTPGNRDWAELTQALAQVIPADKQPSQIGSVKLGPTWIEPRDYEAFVRETFGADSVQVSRAAGTWLVEVPPFERNSALMRTEYGADNADRKNKALDAVDLTEMLLNQRSIVVKNSKPAQEEGGRRKSMPRPPSSPRSKLRRSPPSSGRGCGRMMSAATASSLSGIAASTPGSGPNTTDHGWHCPVCPPRCSSRTPPTNAMR